jgi:hypothetical protein
MQFGADTEGNAVTNHCTIHHDVLLFPLQRMRVGPIGPDWKRGAKLNDPDTYGCAIHAAGRI